MAKTLETELKSGASFFRVYGKAKISEDTFPQEESVSKAGWHYKRMSFPVTVGENNSVYVQMMGGYSEKNPTVFAFDKNNESHRIPWDLRLNEDALVHLADRSFIKVAIEQDDNGKLIQKKFISEIDAINYLSEHLENDMDVYISGDAEYQYYEGETRRSLNIRNIGLVTKEHEPLAEIRQTYLFDSHALDKNWKKELEDKGEIKIHGFVPQYVGKDHGKEIRKTLAMPQTITYKKNKSTKAIEMLANPSNKAVREVTMVNKMVFGLEESTGNVEITPELQEMIEIGLMTKEDAERETTTTGRRVDETVYDHVAARDGRPMISDRYALEALLVPDSEDDEETFEDGTVSATTETVADNTNDQEESVEDATDLFADNELFE